MAKIHLILQGKGGVGKSFIAATLAQYKASKGQSPLCIDTDPVNATFHGYKALKVHKLQIMDGDEIKSRTFDTLVELVATSKNDVIIDNGASSFVPLSHYLISNQVPALLQDMGHELVVHTIITGGPSYFAIDVTVKGKAALTALFEEVRNPETPIVVERLVADIDEIVRIVRFDGWQTTSAGERQVKHALRQALLKYKLHQDRELFDKAYGYAVFPTIGKAGVGLGGAFGKGRVYEKGKVVGDTSMTQVTAGWQLGGEAFSQIIFFQDKRALDEFKKGNFEFSAEASAVAITAAAGAQATRTATSANVNSRALNLADFRILFSSVRGG